MKNLLWFFLFISLGVSAQVADFLPTQKTIAKPFGLPIRISTDGKIEYLVGGPNLAFAPGIQLAWVSNFVQYSIPEIATEFSLQPPKENSGWMEFKRRRYEYGVGLITVLQKTFRLGLAPYKGAKLSMKRLKMDKDFETSGNIGVPDKLEELQTWEPGDEGLYETFGGIQVYAGLDFSIFNAGMATLSWQNQFIISVKRLKDSIMLTITEEKLNRKSFNIGTLPVNGTATHFDGKQLQASFVLEFANPSHHKLYQDAIGGKLDQLEKKLPQENKNIQWKGNDLSVYWGIPLLIGQTQSRGSYHVEDEEQDYYLEVMQNRKSGLLIPPAFHQRFVYHNDESLLLIWATDMKKSAPEKLNKHFFGPARAVGFKGFDVELDEKHYGTVIGEVGVVITKDDVAKFSVLDILNISRSLKARCDELTLSCGQESNARKIMKKFSESMSKEWELRKKHLGILLVKEPALLYALLKESHTSKDAYFKFLSDRYQSLEGLTTLSFE
ncbi:MAG: hypothetical protein V4598_07540 [Bdellovibrionota bacterium]